MEIICPSTLRRQNYGCECGSAELCSLRLFYHFHKAIKQFARVLRDLSECEYGQVIAIYYTKQNELSNWLGFVVFLLLFRSIERIMSRDMPRANICMLTISLDSLHMNINCNSHTSINVWRILRFRFSLTICIGDYTNYDDYLSEDKSDKKITATTKNVSVNE